MENKSNATSISDIKISIKDVLMIVTVITSILGSWFTISSQIRELSTKFEDYRTAQEKNWATEKRIFDIQIKTLELRIERLEKQIQ